MQVIVIDDNGCVRVMGNPAFVQGFLTFDQTSGKLKFVNGDSGSGNGFYLGNIVNTTQSDGLIGRDPGSKMMKSFEPADATEKPAIPYVATNGGNVLWKSFKQMILDAFSIVGNQFGIFARNAAGDLVALDGNNGDVIKRVAGDWVAAPITEPTSLAFGYENLFIRTTNYATTAAMVATLTASADRVIVTDGTNSKLLVAYNQSGDITQSGLGGLDTGSSSNNTWYYVYAIAKPDGTPGLIFSASSTTPSLPVGFTMFRRIGAVRTVLTNQLVTQFQLDSRVFYSQFSPVGSADESNNATAHSIASFTTYIPPIAKTWSLEMAYDASSYAKDISIEIYPPGAVTRYVPTFVMYNGTNYNGGREHYENLPILPGQTPFIRATVVGAIGADAYSISVGALGYTI